MQSSSSSTPSSSFPSTPASAPSATSTSSISASTSASMSVSSHKRCHAELTTASGIITTTLSTSNAAAIVAAPSSADGSLVSINHVHAAVQKEEMDQERPRVRQRRDEEQQGDSIQHANATATLSTLPPQSILAENSCKSNHNEDGDIDMQSAIAASLASALTAAPSISASSSFSRAARPSLRRDASVGERCDRDSLSHIFSFLDNRLFRFILRVSQQWYGAAQLKSAWPRFDTSPYIHQLQCHPVNPPHRSVTVNIYAMGHQHLLATSNKEYLTMKADYERLQRICEKDEERQLKGEDSIFVRDQVRVNKESRDRKAVEMRTFEDRIGSDVLANHIEQSRVDFFTPLIDFDACNNTEAFNRIISCLPLLRAIRLHQHHINGRFDSPSPLCERLEVLELFAPFPSMLNVTHLRSLRVLRIDHLKSEGLVQLHQLEYLEVHTFPITTARAVRYLSVRHQLRSLSARVERLLVEREQLKESIDALALKKWNDLRDKGITRGALDDPTLDDLPPTALTHLDFGTTDLPGAFFLSLCRLPSVRRLRCHCCSIGSIAHLPVARVFLSQLEFLNTNALHQSVLEQCSQLRELQSTAPIAGDSQKLSHIAHLRDLTLSKIESATWTAIQAATQLERLTVIDSAVTLEEIASAVSTFPNFQTLTIITSKHSYQPIVINSRILTAIDQSSTWSTLRLSVVTTPKPTQPSQMWNVNQCQYNMNGRISLTERMKRSFRLHLIQFELVYRVGTNAGSGQYEWQLCNQ